MPETVAVSGCQAGDPDVAGDGPPAARRAPVRVHP